MSAWAECKKVLSHRFRYGDGIAWSHLQAGLCIADGHVVRDADLTLVSSVFAEWGDEARSVKDVPIELLIAVICTEAGDFVGADCGGFRRELAGYVSDEETPDRIVHGPCGLIGGGSLEEAASHILYAISETKFQAPLVAAAYNYGNVRYSPFSPWRLGSYDGTAGRIDRFVSHFNAAIALVQADASLSGDAPSFAEALIGLGETDVVVQPPRMSMYNKTESAVAAEAGVLVLCDSNPSLSAVWSLDIDVLEDVAMAFGAGMGLPFGRDTYEYADRSGALHSLRGEETQRLYRTLRDYLAQIKLFDTDRSPALPGQPAFMG